MEPFLGNSIFTTDGMDWKLVSGLVVSCKFSFKSLKHKQHRAVARPFFSRERISDMNILDEHCAKLIKHLITASESSQPVDIQVSHLRDR